MDQNTPSTGTDPEPSNQPVTPPTSDQPATPPTQSTTPAESKGYGKKPKWVFWLAYIVIGAVVYFLIYYVFFRHTGSSGGSLY